MATEAGHDPRTQPLPPAAGLGQHRARGAGAWPVPPKLLIGGGLLVAAIVFLVVTSLQSNAVYYVTASELLARGSAPGGRGGGRLDPARPHAPALRADRRDRVAARGAHGDDSRSVRLPRRGRVPGRGRGRPSGRGRRVRGAQHYRETRPGARSRRHGDEPLGARRATK